MKKILIVDDEQDIVESLKFVLEVSGFVCYTAYNGEDGLKLAKEIMPDLIILCRIAECFDVGIDDLLDIRVFYINKS